jgi:cytochrome c peroxidase
MLACSHPAFSEQPSQQVDRLLGLPPLEPHALSGESKDKALLGERLFVDKRLSADGKVSCGSCHLSDQSFSDGLPRSKGHAGREGTRNTPSLLNVAYVKPLFWDGRAADLASQARAPFTNCVEHALANEDALLQIVRDDAVYANDFARIFRIAPAVIRIDTISAALIAFERTLLAGGSPFDRFVYGKDGSAMSAQAIRGFTLFKGRAGCAACHSIGKDSSLLSDQEFHMAARGLPAGATQNLAALAAKVVTAKRSVNSKELETLIATDGAIAALGRFVATLQPADIGKFRTPSLRNVALTAPYMHDGSVSTLEEAVDLELYSRGIVTYPIVLTRSEKSELVEFLKMLSSTP